MSKAAEKGCLTCSLAEWQRTPTGRIKQRTPGRCNAPIPDLKPILPASVAQPRLWKAAVWPDQGQDCPTYARAKA
jgi:hypothetical protein